MSINTTTLNNCIDTMPCFVSLLIGEVLIVVGILIVLTWLIEWKRR